MKQLVQSARTGKIEVAEVPAPAVLPGCVLVRVAASLVSAGTERASAEFASKNLLEKAKARPDLAREVWNKARRDGVVSAISAVRSRLDQPLALGYSSAGTVIEVGSGITDLSPGDRVACAGADYAVHAEFACVPRMLVARITSANVDFESAAFTTLGAVALHGVRTAEAALGDTVAVIGLGLLGQITVQVLHAAGCRIVGFDPNPARAQLACRSGALAATALEPEFRDMCHRVSSGHGIDKVLITAETPSSSPVNLASAIARDRAIVVALGTVGMELKRKLYYEKELDFRVSRSYGPGRYDAAFEQKGRDYPIGYVRWSETRNMEAFLQLLSDGKLNLKPLITHSFPIDRASDAYGIVTGKKPQPYLGVVIRYPEAQARAQRRLDLIHTRCPDRPQRSLRVGVLGAGTFAVGTLIPAIKSAGGTVLEGICASNGARARSAAGKFGFAFCTSDEDEILSNPDINTVVIATRHHLHAQQVIRAINAGKHVFCEKPLCLTHDELQRIQSAYEHQRGSAQLVVGFNRRFAPMAKRMRGFLQSADGPLVMHYRVNAAPLPKDHWINDPEQGGGRILGEVCHFVDFLSFLCGAPAIAVRGSALGSHTGEQDAVITIEFGDSSRGTIHYVCSGDRVFGKERVEVFGGGAAAVLDDFRRLELVRHGKTQHWRGWLRQDKGHRSEWCEFAEAIKSGGASPILFDDICATTLATIRISEALRSAGEAKIEFGELAVSAAPLVS